MTSTSQTILSLLKDLTFKLQNFIMNFFIRRKDIGLELAGAGGISSVTLIEDGKMITEDLKIGEIFNHYYTNITEGLET